MNTTLETGLITPLIRARHAVPLQFAPCNDPVGARRAVPLPFKIGLITYILIAAPLTYAEELGRLFFTAEQRAQLEYSQRQSGDIPDNPRSLTVNGIVQKHGGERTVWINGVPQPAGRSDERAPESVPVAIPGQSQPAKVKVGQRVIIGPATTEK
ncbi:MAG: hypothetical protein A2Y51_02170 [Gallionellales bacterium RIFCSPLOWO2_02_60_31]|nr:MAG: hypothetical protein A2Y51_02170 [Gallionellales bacterium RIFCSPLOWO2_02_60_31]